MNFQATKKLIDVTVPSKPIFRGTGKVNRLGEVGFGHSDLFLNGQLSDTLTTEELIDTHLPIMNEVWKPCLLLSVAPNHNQL